MARFISVRFLLAAAVLAGALSVATEIAQAQGLRDDRYFMLRDPFRRNVPFFNFPFGRDSHPRPSYVEPPSDQPVGTVFGSSADADKERLSPATEYVLVFGDTLADQLAQGLADAFVADRPEVVIVKKTKASTGFVRADVYDWPARIPSLLATEKVTAIALMLGANDRQQLRDETGAHEPRSERWRELYGKRVEDTLNRLKEKGVPVFIVGLPAMRSPRLSTDMEYFNDILRERAEKTGAYFVDVWDGFINEKGEYITMGPALDGQIRRLRISDGVHFSKAGGRKLAHYVERDLVRLFDLRGGRPPLLPQQGPEIAPSGRPVAGPVLPLTQPAGPVG
ncbi:MAG: SGNH family hydrolase, partial [Xanthobacteraceae bacterium]|nr:SGNH family hydrolase [Xanthobacteraceae bacterium]